jgi:hypothetical protein
MVSAQTTLRGLIEDDATGNDSVPPQRIGIPAPDPAPSGIPSGDEGAMKLSSNETGELGGYCFDEYLIAPRRVKKFDNVLAGNDAAIVRTADGQQMSLRDAVTKGAVAIRAVQLRVMFTNQTSQPMTISFNGPVVLWDRPAGAVNPAALRALQTSDIDEDTRQNRIWGITTAERRLAVLGYLDGSVWDYNHDRVVSAAQKFQMEKGLQQTGEIDRSTITALATTDAQLRDRLRRMGFADREGRSLHEDLSAQIRAYQRYVGRPATGRWAPELGDRLAVDESIVRQLNQLQVGTKSVEETIGASADMKNVVTYLNNRRGVLVLMETPQGVELWNRSGRDLQFRDRGARAVQALDDAAAALALQATKGDRVVIYPRVGNRGASTVAVGRKTVTVDDRSMAAYLNGGAMPQELAAAIDPLVPNGASTETGLRAAPSLIIYRGPFVQREVGPRTLASLGVDQIDGAKLAKALDRTYGGRANLYLSDDLKVGASLLRDINQGSLDPMRTHGSRLAYAR